MMLGMRRIRIGLSRLVLALFVGATALGIILPLHQALAAGATDGVVVAAHHAGGHYGQGPDCCDPAAVPDAALACAIACLAHALPALLAEPVATPGVGEGDVRPRLAAGQDPDGLRPNADIPPPRRRP